VLATVLCREACPAPSDESMWSFDQQQASASTASARSATPKARSSSLQPPVRPIYGRWRLRPRTDAPAARHPLQGNAPAPSSRAVLSRRTNLSSRWIIAYAGVRLLPLAHSDTPCFTLEAVASARWQDAHDGHPVRVPHRRSARGARARNADRVRPTRTRHPSEPVRPVDHGLTLATPPPRRRTPSVLLDAVEREAERLGELADRGRPAAEALQDAPARRIRQGEERPIECSVIVHRSVHYIPQGDA
jgi:hypothetical protein